jgi:DNA-directed RNA polymerase subunit N (RpoN/RPB10)
MLKRETDKYKGMFPLKCFNCGKIVHFANKCSYAKKSDSYEEEYPKKERREKIIQIIYHLLENQT